MRFRDFSKRAFSITAIFSLFLSSSIVCTTPVFAKNGGLIIKDCGDGWIANEGDTACTPAEPSKDSEAYTNFKNGIKNTIGYYPATAIIKTSQDINFYDYGAKNIVKGPDGYYIVEFYSMVGLNAKMKKLASQSGVEYAGQNFGTVDKALVESDNFEETFKKYVEGLIEIHNTSNATRPSDAKLKELEDGKGDKVKFKGFEAFYQDTNGKCFGTGQCVAGVQHYISWLGYDKFAGALGNAIDYWKNRYTSGILEDFIEIDPSDQLQDGDILVWGEQSGEYGQYGHIAIYHKGFSYGQNQGSKDPKLGGPFNEAFSYSSLPNFLGALRPKCYRNGSEKYKIRVNLRKSWDDPEDDES